MTMTAGAASVLRAAIASFGFVFIHPMVDENGRISRFLVNDVLRRDVAVPAPFILPISATITNSTKERVGPLKGQLGLRTYIDRKNTRKAPPCAPAPLVGAYAHFGLWMPFVRPDIDTILCYKRKIGEMTLDIAAT